MATLVRGLVDGKSSWVDQQGLEKPVTLEDILIIAPYNAQVFKIQERLPRARVGTVDKFQGQEAPVVIYSMATSTPADAPHGMEFLYSLNRLNVATSRARCVCVLVGSPELFAPQCQTPRQMQLANAFRATGSWRRKSPVERERRGTGALIDRSLKVQWSVMCGVDARFIS